MAPAQEVCFQDVLAVLATMHGKERVIAPPLGRFLGLRVEPARGLDTDRFGTFSRDVERTGSQLDAAHAKIAAACVASPRIRVGLASEGSFGPHPFLPFVREIVVLIDRQVGLDLIGHYADLGVNFAHAVVSDVGAVIAFVERVGFPEHGVIVMGCADGKPEPSLGLIKTISGPADLERVVEGVTAGCGEAFIKTDSERTAIPSACAPSGAPCSTWCAASAADARPAIARVSRLLTGISACPARGARSPPGSSAPKSRLARGAITPSSARPGKPQPIQANARSAIRDAPRVPKRTVVRSTNVTNNRLQEAERRISWVLDHPHVSAWLKDALRNALTCDPVVVLNDVEMLRELLRLRTEILVDQACGQHAILSGSDLRT